MVTFSPDRAELLPGEPCFLILAAAPTAAPPLDWLCPGAGATVRRVRVVPDARIMAAGRWPTFDGFAVFDVANTLKRLFVVDPVSRGILEWRLPARVSTPAGDTSQTAPAKEAV